jgi:hypothetical protein
MPGKKKTIEQEPCDHIPLLIASRLAEAERHDLP